VAAVPARRPVTLVGQILAFLAALNKPRDGRKVKAFVLVLAGAAREHVTTVAAFGAIDFGCFRASPVAGWIALGVSLLIVEFKVRG
jgi:hypothetical protein